MVIVCTLCSCGNSSTDKSDKNKDTKWAKDIVAAYHSKEFADYMKVNNKGLWFVPTK